jgi:CheY-like chemotaxis protein
MIRQRDMLCNALAHFPARQACCGGLSSSEKSVDSYFVLSRCTLLDACGKIRAGIARRNHGEWTYMTIVVVDDSEDVRNIVEAILFDAGYSDVVLLPSASAALSYLADDPVGSSDASRIGMVLLDINMPEMDGIKTCERIRSDARYSDVPIVMASSCDDMQSVDTALAKGATDYLTKPLKAVDLVACVRSKLKLKEERDRHAARERELLLHQPFRFR